MMDGLGALSMGWAYFARLLKDQAGARRRQHHHQEKRGEKSKWSSFRLDRKFDANSQKANTCQSKQLR